MSMARANCTCATCGHTFEVRAKRANSRDAASFEKWAEENITECDDCKAARIQAAHDAENAEAAKAAQEMGYPELKGTEKQVAWANTIREKMMSILREFYLAPEQIEKHPEAPALFAGLSKIILGHAFAGWWIENMNSVLKHPAEIAVRLMIKALEGTEKDMAAMNALQQEVYGKKAQDAEQPQQDTAPEQQPQEAPQPQEQPAPQRPEAQPETRKHEGAADVTASGNMVAAVYAKDESFREIVKAMGFAWKDGRWQIEAAERTGKAEDISAELGSRLLNAGFAVRFDSREIMNMAVTGSYTPMCRRWIASRAGGFYITWSREDDHYRAAKSLPGAVYDSPGVIVPERSWDALTDFAARYGYRFTAAAQDKLDRLSGAARAVEPAPVRKPEYDERDVLKSSRDVLDDLKD